MQTPSETQINKFLAYLSELEIFKWNHVGDLEPDEDLVSVVNWLKDNTPLNGDHGQRCEFCGDIANHVCDY